MPFSEPKGDVWTDFDWTTRRLAKSNHNDDNKFFWVVCDDDEIKPATLAS